MTHFRHFICFLFMANAVPPAATASTLNLKDTLFHQVASAHGLDPLLLYSIAITESARGVGKGYIQPHPYVFRTSSGPRYFKTKEESEQELIKILPRTKNIDIGMMQINLHYHPQPNPVDLLDPHYNLSVAAKYLKTTMASTDDPVIGVGRFHSWTPDLALWYGTRVWKTYDNLLPIYDFD